MYNRLLLSVCVVGHACLFAAWLSGAGARTRGGGGSLKAVRPIWPRSVCLDDRNNDNVYHFFFLSLAGLRQHERPGYSVVVHALFNLTMPYHVDGFELLAPEFNFDPHPPPGVAHRCAKFDSRTDGWPSPEVFDASGKISWCAQDDDALPPRERACVYEVGTLVTAAGSTDSFPLSAHHFFRDFFRKKLFAAGLLPDVRALDPGALYYIMRKTKGVREIMNEAEYLPGLKALGFKFIHLEEFRVLEKLRLFATARCIVSPQSSSSVFMAVMDTRALFIEIFPRDAPNQMAQFVNMAADVGVPFRRYTEVDTVYDNIAPPLHKGMYGIFNMRVKSPEALVQYVAAQVAETDAEARLPDRIEAVRSPTPTETPWALR